MKLLTGLQWPFEPVRHQRRTKDASAFLVLRKISLQILIFLSLSVVLAFLRPFLPPGIAWNGKWPTNSTTAFEAYKMMAKPGDPAFIGLAEVIEAQRENSAVLIDARSVPDFTVGRIPGSRNLPYYEIEKYQDKALADLRASSPIIIYCEGVGCELSFFLGRELTEAGYKNVRIFYGGYPEWSEAGLPIEK